MKNLKQYVGFVRDHSGSMGHISRYAMLDYNTNLEALREASNANNIATIVSTVKCGVGFQGTVEREVVNSPLDSLHGLSFYQADGGYTPLFDSVGELIEIMEMVPDIHAEGVSFLVTVITDGQENNSKKWSGSRIALAVKRLQATDRWTFAFRVPIGQKSTLTRFGIPDGNILEWETNPAGFEKATRVTNAAYANFYNDRAVKGVTASRSMFSDVADIKPETLKRILKNISGEITFFPVKNGGCAIKPFIEALTGTPMITGSVFYQLTKPEKEVQDYKMICIRDKVTGAVYGGRDARRVIGLPESGTIKLAPGAHGNYDVFIQSTSVNRILIANTQVLHWPGYKMGII